MNEAEVTMHVLRDVQTAVRTMLEVLVPASPRLVIVESPYAAWYWTDDGGNTVEPDSPGAKRHWWEAQVEANLQYARCCIRDCLDRGEAPIASHLLFTQEGILDDKIPAEREMGIAAGFAWKRVAHATVVYTDHGVSSGMKAGIAESERLGRRVEYRQLGFRVVAVSAA